MTGKERFLAIAENRSDCCGFWHGHPHKDSQQALFQYFGVKDDFELGVKLGDTVCWCMPEENQMWKHPTQKPMFDFLEGRNRVRLEQEGVFVDCTNPKEVENFEWPDVKYCDFTPTLALIDRAQKEGMAVLSGVWSPFFHDVANAFGMEEYFIKMYTDPEVVQAVTNKVVDFYLQASTRLFDLAGDKIDAFFFGNDFGSQLDLLISPQAFETFILPSFIQFTKLAKSRGYKVVLHSCGAISRAIPYLVDAGVDVLHPLQAKARNMDADYLAQHFKGKISFMGGIDMQQLLTFGTPDEIYADVARVVQTLGNNFIISPSHECILPNVPPANLQALAQAAA
ncbi:MAG: uroporphyrinogen decarboxylase family protein, partial [Ruthenibacterium sp.]